MPQFEWQKLSAARCDFSIGLAMFVIGLAKKLLIADSLAEYADHSSPRLQASRLVLRGMGGRPGLCVSAVFRFFGLLGHGDRAVAAFRRRLPLNFNSPYKASNHRVLASLAHDAVSVPSRLSVFPFGGNRQGPIRRHVNLMATMLLGGLWHGAGWNFVIWGGLHGLYLIVNHAWQSLRPNLCKTAGGDEGSNLMDLSLCDACLGFLSILRISRRQFGFIRVVRRQWACRPGVARRADAGCSTADRGAGDYYLPRRYNQFVLNWAWVVVASALVFSFPNSQELLRRYRPAFSKSERSGPGLLSWRPTAQWALIIGFLGYYLLPVAFPSHRVSLLPVLTRVSAISGALVATTLLLVLVLVAAFNVLIDPYGYFRTPAVPGLNSVKSLT